MEDDVFEEYFESTEDLPDYVQGALDHTMESMLMMSDEDISPRDIARERGNRFYEDQAVDPEWDGRALPETPSLSYDYGAVILSIPLSFVGMCSEYAVDKTDFKNPSEYVLDRILEE